ncbi:MAG TPA: sucrose phosphorylase [Epulopiscium sp.]|nr:sucrose phosphorylase [Candidatus Epulonipiscium sp.]
MEKNLYLNWNPKEINNLEAIPKGDMPGDQIKINAGHVEKAHKIFPRLLELVEPILTPGPNKRVIISVHGGSGVGKSETASLLSYYFNELGIGSYILSGDNYPRRIPQYNDAERLRVFRISAIKGLVDAGEFSDDRKVILFDLQEKDQDANPELTKELEWLRIYQEAGKQGLNNYLGSKDEIDFDELNEIIRKFKNGAEHIMLKRMGREQKELWYDPIDFRDKKVLIVEWTHGNNPNLVGVDIPILLNSTPEETLAHRKMRNRDGGTDSPFTAMVLKLEQGKLHAGAEKVKIIVSKDGDILAYDEYLKAMNKSKVTAGVMLNAYPDSIGGTLGDITQCLKLPELKDAFSSFYILPSVFNTDLDRGFSVIDYELNEMLASRDNLEELKDQNIDFKFDFIMNHASVLSKEFKDIIANGEASKYKDFFINWNKFWHGHGEMTPEGYIQPKQELIKDMFFRKPGLPILNIRFPDGSEVPYWNTFYQEVAYDALDTLDLMDALGIQYGKADAIVQLVNAALLENTQLVDIDFGRFSDLREEVVQFIESKRKYLGQMDLNIKSPLVWEFYDDTLKKLAGYGAQIVRLDAFAYAPKEPGEKNFLNEPGTWELLAKLKILADKHGVTLLPEIHTRYEEMIHEKISEHGYMTYDFFLPGLLIDAFERKTSRVLIKWIKEIQEKNIKTVNMLGCHDGIPLLDLKGLLEDEQIESLIDLVVSRGGYVKNLHGQKNIYYQVNATYYSALGEDDKKLLLARAIQMFMPGKPQVWYLDLFAGKNNHKAVEKAGSGGHKEINRTNLSLEQIQEGLQEKIVVDQIKLIKFRNTFPAFGFDAKLTVLDSEKHMLKLRWEKKGYSATLSADLESCEYKIQVEEP